MVWEETDEAGAGVMWPCDDVKSAAAVFCLAWLAGITRYSKWMEGSHFKNIVAVCITAKWRFFFLPPVMIFTCSSPIQEHCGDNCNPLKVLSCHCRTKESEVFYDCEHVYVVLLQQLNVMLVLQPDCNQTVEIITPRVFMTVVCQLPAPCC